MNRSTAPDWGAAVLRWSLGVMYLSHAWLKVGVFTLPGTVKFFEGVGLPGALVYPVVAAEITGGIALLLGVWTRQVAFALIPVLLGAAWVHWPNGWVFNANGGGWEYPVFLAVVSIVSGLLGEGRFALRPGTPLASAQGAVR